MGGTIMSKFICDVCGTTYPETASQCPICGSANKSVNQTAAGTDSGATGTTSGYAYTKGGRFSKRNVRKRNRRSAAATTSRSTATATTTRSSTTAATPTRSSTAASASRSTTSSQRRSENKSTQENETPNNNGLVLVVILLMLAIVAVLIYIGVHFFANQEPDETKPSNQSTQGSEPTESTGKTEVLCQGLALNVSILELNIDESWPLSVELTPVDTTQAVVYESENPEVATVTADGIVTVVGPGETRIVVTCGDQTAVCDVKSNAQVVPDPTQPSQGEDPVTGVFEFEFNTPYKDDSTGYGDCTLSKKGETWRAYKRTGLTVDPTEITWTSDNSSVCTVKDGIVTAVGKGKTLIHATYNGVTYTCIVRCSWKDTESSTTEPTDPNGGNTNSSDFPFEFKVSDRDESTGYGDCTLSIGEIWRCYKSDLTIDPTQITWTTDNADVCTIANGIVTAVGSGKTLIHATYNGVTYTCIVRVK